MTPVRKSLAAAVAALGLVTATAPRAQMPPFAIPIGAEILLGPLLLLVGAALLLHPDDQRQLRSLERLEQWDEAERLASRRIEQLDARPDDGRRREELAQWLVVRGEVRRMRQHWAQAADDFGRAASLSERTAPASLRAQAACLGMLKRWADADRALVRLAELEPAAADTWRQLAIVRTIAGDAAGASEAVGALRTRAPELAAAVERDWIGPYARTDGLPLRDAPLVGHDLAQAVAPGLLMTSRIGVVGRELVLPPGRWVLASVQSQPVRGRRGSQLISDPDLEVSALAGTALALRDRELHGAVSLHTNRRSDLGISSWRAEPCRAADAFLTDRFAGRFDTPECLQLRRVDAASPGAPAALAAARDLGATVLPSYVEVRYENYAIDRFVAVTVLLPGTDDAGRPLDDAAATAWARALVAPLRALAHDRSRTAELPSGIL